ncbi:ECF transporter S component [Raoultibacter timonensis]|uniref:ECF transporter S component n=1 Tax=Raoultibacter timonensis TaxID=1907662 RepID=UPI001C640779|nr:ECF transporter S component [Raoultibacter timonensis]
MIARVLPKLEIPALAAVLAALAFGAVAQFDQTALLSLGVVVGALVVFFARFETSKPALRQIMPTVVLAALAAAGRILFAALPDFKPVSAIAIIAGAAFGRQAGFMVGALAALVSNLFFGQGPWTPWQMYAWGLIGYFAGVLADRGAFEKRPVLYVYGFAAPLLYGFLLNSYYIVGFVHPLTWQTALLAYGAGLPFDLVHGAATVVFLAILYQPWRKKLDRIKRKYGI